MKKLFIYLGLLSYFATSTYSLAESVDSDFAQFMPEMSSQTPLSEGDSATSAEGDSESSAGSTGSLNQFEIDITDALANRRTANPQASSAIITSASTNKILRQGFFTLQRYLGTIPGFDPINAFWNTWPAARGIPGSVNFMIDGVSATSPTDYRYPAGMGLFLEEFDGVEAISGPAGVPWSAHSLLGVVNMLTGRTPQEGTTLRAMYGNQNTQRISLRDDRILGQGTLRLFAGYAGQTPRSFTTSHQISGTPPYARDWSFNDQTITTTPNANQYLTFSARYAGPSLVAYLRLPYSRETYEVSELGGVFTDGTGGRRESYDAVGYIAYQKSLFDGQLAFLARLNWYLLAEQFDQKFFPASEVTPRGARSVQEVLISRTQATMEGQHRLQLGSVRSELIGGVEGTLEVPHRSRFLVADGPIDESLTDRGPLFRPRATAQTFSSYLFEELRLWERLSIAGGSRVNVSTSYETVFMWQANTAVRLLGDSYAKFGFTEGMRPPSLLHREGIQPAIGNHRLVPEKSQAFQLELNGKWTSTSSWIQDVFGRINYIQTTLLNPIECEGLLTAAYTCSPAPTPNLSIQTIETFFQFEFAKDVSANGMYRFNIFREEDRAEVGLFNPAPNHGPTHAWQAGIEVAAHEYVTLRGNVQGRCGGLWQIIDPVVRSGRRPSTITQDMGCYHFLDFLVRFPSEPTRAAISFLVENVLDQRPPVAMFQFPELQGGESGHRQSMGRTFFVMLEWWPRATHGW